MLVRTTTTIIIIIIIVVVVVVIIDIVHSLYYAAMEREYMVPINETGVRLNHFIYPSLSKAI